ncbi:hypothetical protein A6E13_16585 [Aliivibrio fischeri]|nr:hypothetical protein A6E13_16585 [Aliivibrio fischeri]
MSNMMIDLMRGCLLVVVLICVGGGGLIGFSFVANPYTPIVTKILMIGSGLLVGLIVASIFTGICFLLLNINDNLNTLANAAKEESD